MSSKDKKAEKPKKSRKATTPVLAKKKAAKKTVDKEKAKKKVSRKKTVSKKVAAKKVAVVKSNEKKATPGSVPDESVELELKKSNIDKEASTIDAISSENTQKLTLSTPEPGNVNAKPESKAPQQATNSTDQSDVTATVKSVDKRNLNSKAFNENSQKMGVTSDTMPAPAARRFLWPSVILSGLLVLGGTIALSYIEPNDPSPALSESTADSAKATIDSGLSSTEEALAPVDLEIRSDEPIVTQSSLTPVIEASKNSLASDDMNLQVTGTLAAETGVVNAASSITPPVAPIKDTKISVTRYNTTEVKDQLSVIQNMQWSWLPTSYMPYYLPVNYVVVSPSQLINYQPNLFPSNQQYYLDRVLE